MERLHKLSIHKFTTFYLLCIFHYLMTKGITEGAVKHSHMYTLCAVPGYDYFNLTALPWFVSVKPSACVSLPNATGSGGENVAKCLILMRFCQKLHNFGNGCKNSSICQKSTEGDVSLGAYKDNPFLVGAQASHEGFEADIPKGMRYQTPDGKPCDLQTLVTFRCNHSTIWEAPSSYMGIKRAPDPLSVDYDADKCQLKLQFDYAGACKVKIPKQDSILSIGSVVLIVFSITIVLYLVLGCILNLAKGNSGRHIIPHVAVWISFAGYISDGFKFIFCPGVRPLRAMAYDEIKS